MKIHSSDVILSSVFDDEPLNDAMNKASFGGDRSAAGRYAAEQRWKNHQKKDDKPSGGRTTDQKLAEGPTNLLFGRDANGMPIMGTVKELKAKYGKSAKAREEYFRTRYGVRLKIKTSPAGSIAEAVQLGTLQALEEICLSTVLDNDSMRGVSVGDTGGDPHYKTDANGWYSNGYITVKPETIEKRLGDLLNKTHGLQIGDGFGLKPSTKEDEEWYGANTALIPQWSTSQMFPSIPAVAQDLRPYFATDPMKHPLSRKDIYVQMAQRAGYAVMVHEFGHAVDFGGSERKGSVSDELMFPTPNTITSWQDLRAPTEYGRANQYEKAAESFAAWWLFGGGQGNLPKGIAGIGRLAEPILRPILEARGEFVKSMTPPIDIAALPLNHPVVLFILAPLMDDGVVKARVRVDAMVAAALAKASFGGDRSAAGRYAAEQRWKGHVKGDISQKVTLGFEPRGYKNDSGTVYATDKETGKVIGALSFDGYFIGKVYVLPEYRRKGVAKYLYEEAKKRNGGLEMRADDYTVAGAAFMSAVTGKEIYQSGDQSQFSWKPWLERLENDAMNKASFGGDRSAAGRYAAEQRWKGHVKQSVGRNDKNSSDKLSLDELKTILESAGSAAEAHQMIVERLGKTMKPKVEDLSDDEINAWRSISDNGAKRLVEGKILNAEFATYGQGLYVMMAGQADGGMTKEDAKYRTLYYGKNMVGLRLSESAKIVDGAKRSFSLKAVDARKEIEKTGSVRLLSFYSHKDFHNLYWASQGFDGWVPYGRKMGGEVVFFNAEHLSVNRADLPPQVANRKVRKSFIRRDAMVDLALDKASFGGDRSAAGRYAAEQRWKGHVKRQTRTGGNRSTDEQLSQGPQNLAFGRDKNGLPIVGTRKELEEKYGKTDKQRREYFQNKYGVTVKFADSDRHKTADAIQAKLGAVQALDDILSNLNVIPVGLTQKPPISTIQIGTQNPMRSPFTNQIPVAFVSHDNVDSRKFLLAVDTAEAAAIVPYLLSKTTPITEEDASSDDDKSSLDVINLRRLQETSNESVANRFGVTDANRDKRTPTREDEASIARRLGYAIMVHEWGHVLDTQSFFDAKQRAGVKDMTSNRSDKDDSSTFSQTQPVSEYGRYNVWEKQAEGFTAWFLFSQSTNQVLIYSPKTNVGFSEASRWLKEQTVVDMKGLISPTMRPLFDSLRPPQTGEQVLKQVTDYVTTVADLPFDHPVVVFALQEFSDDGVAKARPENPWKRGYNTQYFRVRDSVLARKPLCYKCKKNRASEVDHVRPLINGGSNTVGNLRPVCVSCNRKSGGGERRVRKSVRVDAMVRLALNKASFGGDRSAAGRYAAEQRWKGHAKAEAKPAVAVRDAQLLEAIGQGQKRDDGPTPEMQAIATELNKRFNLATMAILYDVGENFSEGKRRAAEEMLKDPAISAAKNLKELREAGQAFTEKHADHPNAEDYKSVSENFNRRNRMGFGSGADFSPPEEYTGENTAGEIVWTVTEKWNYDDQGQNFAYYLRRALADEFGASIGGKPETPEPQNRDLNRKEVYDSTQLLQTAMRTVVRVMYENTQEQLRALSPATHLVLYRGTKSPNDKTAPQTGSVPLRGVTSWSGEKEVGQGWSKSEGNALLEAAIPFSQIFGTPRSGFGRPHNELRASYTPLSEYLVMGPSVEATVEITEPKTPSADLQKAQVRRDAMVEAALVKASFGGDRSAAGRYAAEQRWQGHVRADAEQILRVRGGIIDTVRREEGMSVKIDSGLQPKDGYMVARKEYSKIVSAEDFFDATKGKKILGDFLKENREHFQKDQYLGIWWNTKTGKVYLDITDNISDRNKAESLGKERNQISIWDVVNKVEIQTGGTGEG